MNVATYMAIIKTNRHDDTHERTRQVRKVLCLKHKSLKSIIMLVYNTRLGGWTNGHDGHNYRVS